MPFLINNISYEVYFSDFAVTTEVLSGTAEEFPYSGIVDVFDNNKLIDTGRINAVYEKYNGKAIIYKRHSENSKLEKEKIIIKTKSKAHTKTAKGPNYKLVNTNEPDVYINKKFLT